jgi:hypothetical protein
MRAHWLLIGELVPRLDIGSVSGKQGKDARESSGNAADFAAFCVAFPARLS